MAKQDTRKRRNPAVGESNLNRMLEILLAYDRSVVEFSMGVYNVSRSDRDAIREQNQRLHDALRQHHQRPVCAAPVAIAHPPSGTATD